MARREKGRETEMLAFVMFKIMIGILHYNIIQILSA